ncbi:tRNA (guanine-N(7)-)-methyltransferase non-catalytic subunit wuho [Gryllus bimaculatus]|nr:tRNA (guanine-N(7)-)-methyltransferase non-catalytic subunit wuho [Gryllus bimaculatus]
MKEPKLHVLELPSSPQSETKNGQKESGTIESKPLNAYIMGLDVSRCNRWLAVSSSDKQLCLWDTIHWTFVSSRSLVRAADKIKFSPSSDNVTVADKSGDVYLFSVMEPNKEGVLLLGHLSMLLDVLMSDDERYIITCDRDEKIRVSHFPNAYNIQSYCLGHTEFVSCLSFLPHNKSVLVSGSGDGSVKFWNYESGILISDLVCPLQNAKESESSGNTKAVFISDNKMCSEDNLSITGEMTSAVMHISCCKYNTSSLVGVSLVHFKGCLLYKVIGDQSNISYSMMQQVVFQTEPWDINLSAEGILWYLSCNEKNPLNFVYFDTSGKMSDSEQSGKVSDIVSLVNSHNECFTQTAISERVCVLYKRKFDNVQEYLERKKLRLSS